MMPSRGSWKAWAVTYNEGMPFVDDFADCLNDTATWKRFQSRDRAGSPTYDAGITFTARLVEKNRLIRAGNGDQIVSSSHVFLGTTDDTNLEAPPDVDPEDQILLSNGDTPTIAKVDRPQDETGVAAYTLVYFL